MKGARADPPATTINNPNISNMVIKGSSQNFFLVFMNPQSSRRNSIGLGF